MAIFFVEIKETPKIEALRVQLLEVSSSFLKF